MLDRNHLSTLVERPETLWVELLGGHLGLAVVVVVATDSAIRHVIKLIRTLIRLLSWTIVSRNHPVCSIKIEIRILRSRWAIACLAVVPESQLQEGSLSSGIHWQL